MYQKILVPMALDHGISEHTLKVARALCAPGGEITALHVYEAPQGSVSAFLDKEAVQEGFERAGKMLAARLEALPDVHSRLIKGHTARSIIDFAAANATDCIVIGSHRPGLSDYFLGSTASRVVRHAACAVHVHRSA
ncbi:universal stress protein [Pseudophaeobacter leonis]|uniref:universal stress protein n=1 Tax=Pseudophaeobacter leonis TaxID=1144477 RepID=UPI0009F57C54|nr:universal stress protein [Pseudophaeobacter leonis]